ncbi:MAG TPA: methyltransferase domain-containing protein [Thermoanaerobaculia bacterium]|nr:methyltransferase domain-containing protein [Thermoanaerobaculia bacterium]
MATDRAELARLYAGDHGRSWSRIELERPATYWEENAVAARRLTRRAISAWLEPLDLQIVLDAGCGAGALARHLVGLGAGVTALDVLPRFADAARRPRGLHFVVGDLRQRVSPPAAYTTVVAQEVLEDYPPEERLGLVQALAQWEARRMILALRIPSAWGEWSDRLAGRARHPPVDTVALFRGIHLETPYFLTRRETLRRRNHVVEIAEFSLAGG